MLDPKDFPKSTKLIEGLEQQFETLEQTLSLTFDTIREELETKLKNV
jgi:hypothetical protein